jgi:transposase-like protein
MSPLNNFYYRDQGAVFELVMAVYSAERKEAVLKKLLPPYNMSVAVLAKQEGISEQTLYNWRTKIKQQGQPVPGNKSTPEQWSSEAKLAVVISTATLTESELSKYCRESGLFVDQVKRWKEECLGGFQLSAEQSKESKQQTIKDKNEIKLLKKELRRKEKALAETAALLVLRKKLNALWEEDEES